MFRKDLDKKILWKSYDQIIQSADLESIVQSEFPVDASVFQNAISRRHFFKIMSASIALAGLTSCKFSPAAKIVSFVRSPEGLVPGKSIYYARSLNRGQFAVGVLVESFMGRPIKIEGNPEHPMSLGASDIFLQAEILNLYDPDRLQSPLKNKKKTDWSTFDNEWKQVAAAHLNDGGESLRLLINGHSSESTSFQEERFLKRFPKAKIISYAPMNEDSFNLATQLSFGKRLVPLYDFKKAQVILSIEHDFFIDKAAGLLYSKDFADKRRLINSSNIKINRLYAIESDHTMTGSMADHRLARSRSEIEQLILYLATLFNIPFKCDDFKQEGISSQDKSWLQTMTKDLKENAGLSIITGGEYLAPEFQSLLFAMNEKLGNIGNTIHFYQDTKNSVNDLETLVNDINQGLVKGLFIIESNPAYTSARDLNFTEALKKVGFSVCLSQLPSETSNECLWSLPLSHPLESWSDARAVNGLLSINQPLIKPLFDSMSACELLSFLCDDKKTEDHVLVKNYWQTKINPLLFNHWWEMALAHGLVENSASHPEKVKLKNKPITLYLNRSFMLPDYLELHFKADPTIGDGTYANNGWLQELPKPMTKLTWSNAALISPALARTKSLENGNIITIITTQNKVNVPVWILPGLANKVLIIHFGHGRRIAGGVGEHSGVDAYQMMHSKMSDGVERGIFILKTNQKKQLACTQEHHSFESREPIVIHHANEYQTMQKELEEKKSFYPDAPVPQSPDYAWGMSIDLNVCTGCNACVIGCQAENNVPIVGEAEVIHGREMHWLRIDRYFEGTPDLAKAYFQPLACVHCEKAPCEVVCPVAATVHSNEGLNEMVYNRCVGTRYCSNNCPYKVRRFNFLEYHHRESHFLKMRANPDVSVRSRGVMEKCTYCVQRINEKRVVAEIAGRKILDGEIQTACQQACATEAIVFGNLLDPKSKVSRLHLEKQSYELLGELATLPRTQYLARFINTNPEMKS